MKTILPTMSLSTDVFNRQSLYIDKSKLVQDEIDLLKKDSSYVKLWIIRHVIINLNNFKKPEVIRQIEFYDIFVENMK